MRHQNLNCASLWPNRYNSNSRRDRFFFTQFDRNAVGNSLLDHDFNDHGKFVQNRSNRAVWSKSRSIRASLDSLGLNYFDGRSTAFVSVAARYDVRKAVALLSFRRWDTSGQVAERHVLEYYPSKRDRIRDKKTIISSRQLACLSARVTNSRDWQLLIYRLFLTARVSVHSSHLGSGIRFTKYCSAAVSMRMIVTAD